MDAIERLTAADEIRNLRARYCRAIDQKDREAFRSVFARNAVADYREGRQDVEPMRGADAITDVFMAALPSLITVHHCATGEIHVDTPDTARGDWPMVARVLYPPGGKAREEIGYGFYHETYVREDGAWKIKTLALTRTRVDTIPA